MHSCAAGSRYRHCAASPALTVLLQVLPHEPDAAAAASCKQAIANLLLHLLLHLTASWPPPPLAELAFEAVVAPGAASLLPSAASVTPPVPLTLAGKQATVASPAAVPVGDAVASSSTGGQEAQNTTDRRERPEASDAADVLCSLLQLLHEAGCDTWQSLARKPGEEAAGAALAALYASCLDATEPAGVELLQAPVSGVETLQVG
jgi:hypothetical protein